MDTPAPKGHRLPLTIGKRTHRAIEKRDHSDSQVRCRCCRHWFVPNFRNRSKTKHPQKYCPKPACQAKSRIESKKLYRRAEPEDKVKVRIRVAECRQKQERDESTPPGAQPLDTLATVVADLVIARIEAVAPRMVADLTERLAATFAGSHPALSDSVVGCSVVDRA